MVVKRSKAIGKFGEVRNVLPGIFANGPFFLRIAVYFSLFLFSLSSATQAQELNYVNLTTRDGLPSNTVYASLQDRKGDMWFATELGLSRYNGFNFENFRLNEGLTDLEILKIFHDSRGRVWLVMSNGTLSYLKDGVFFHAGNQPFLNSLKVSSFFNGFLEQGDGSLWFTSMDDGIFRLSREGTVSRLQPLTDMPGRFVYPGIWKDEKGDVRVCTDAGIVNLSINPGLAEVPMQFGIDEIRFSKQLRNGDVILGIGRKILICHPPSGKFREIGSEAGYDDYMITNIAETAEGHLWISAINGLHFFRKGLLKKEAHMVFLKGKTLSGLQFDRQGNLWVSTLNNGVFLASDMESLRLNHRSGIPEIPVTALFRHRGKLFWGNDRGDVGIIQHMRSRMLKTITDKSPFGRGRVREFVQAPDKPEEVWAATENGLLAYGKDGLLAYFGSPSKCLAFSGNDAYLGNAKSCIRIKTPLLRIKGKYLLFGLKKENRSSIETNQLFRQMWNSFENLLPATRVYKVAADPPGTIWMATHSGLFSLNGASTTYYKEKHEELGLPFQSLALFGSEVQALGSNGRGLLLFENGKRTWITEKTGLYSSNIRNLRTQGNDSLWVCTTRGLNLIVRNSNNRRYMVEKWKLPQSAAADEDVFDVDFHNDTLWTACGKTIQCIPSPEILKEQPKYYPEAELLQVNGKQVPAEPDAKILHAEPGALIRIFLRYPDYRLPLRRNFQYRLFPDTNWKELAGNVLTEKIPEAGSFILQIRNPVDDTGNASINLLEIESGSLLQRFRQASGNMPQNLILFLLPPLLLLLSWFLYFRQLRKSNFPEDDDFFVRLTTVYQSSMATTEYDPQASEKWLLLRGLLRNTGRTHTFKTEIEICRAYADFLQVCHPGFQLSFEAEASLNQLSVKTHCILDFLLKQQAPFQNESARFICWIEKKEKNFPLSLVRDTGDQHQEIAAMQLPLANDKVFSALLRRLRRLFP